LSTCFSPQYLIIEREGRGGDWGTEDRRKEEEVIEEKRKINRNLISAEERNERVYETKPLQLKSTVKSSQVKSNLFV